MKISINEGYFRRTYDGNKQRNMFEAIQFCRDGGFENIDFDLGSSLPEQNLILREKYIEDTKLLREFCDRNGVEIDQSHARFDYVNIKREDFKPQMIRTVEVSKILGVKNIVIHADSYYDPDIDVSVKRIYEDYSPMVEVAKKCGVNIAIETLFENQLPKDEKRWRFTSTVEELDAIVSKFNDPCVGICWDFGHAKVMYEEKQFEQMKRVGDKIIATHIHDNYYSQDLHLPPYLGKTDWKEGLQTLKEIGYAGTLTLEIVYGCLPDELLMEYLRFCRKVVGHMAKCLE